MDPSRENPADLTPAPDIQSALDFGGQVVVVTGGSRGIGAGIHYPVPLHLQPAYKELGHQPGDLPVTEAVADSCLSLPLYPEMTDAQQDRIIAAIAEFLDG